MDTSRKRNKIKVADLHCDLLAYLANEENADVMNREALCSLPQLQEGGVFFQALAIFTQTKRGSVDNAALQMGCFKELLQHPDFAAMGEGFPEGKVTIAPAIENASGLVEEDEPLDLAFERLENFPAPLYISLTWNDENRFGGGNASDAGLKRDGEVLLEYIADKKIAIDLSHTSDALAHDIINYIDKKGLKLTPIASHSNCREVCHVARNLPDELIHELIYRKGLMGLNFVRRFVGKEPPRSFMRHIEHMRSLDGLKALCMGADFFYPGTVSHVLKDLLPFFYKEFGSASCFPELFEHFSEILSEEEKLDIAHNNFNAFLEREGLYAYSG